MKKIEIASILFSSDEINAIFKSCPVLESFELIDNGDVETGLPVINEFPSSFPRSLTKCIFGYPLYSPAFVLRLLAVPNLRILGKALDFAVQAFQPEDDKEWAAVSELREVVRGGKYVRLIGIDNDDDEDEEEGSEEDEEEEDSEWEESEQEDDD